MSVCLSVTLAFILFTIHAHLFRLGLTMLEPYCETVFAAVLFADISGFTRLSARLSEDELKFHIKYGLTLLSFSDITNDPLQIF